MSDKNTGKNSKFNADNFKRLGALLLAALMVVGTIAGLLFYIID